MRDLSRRISTSGKFSNSINIFVKLICNGVLKIGYKLILPGIDTPGDDKIIESTAQNNYLSNDYQQQIFRF